MNQKNRLLLLNLARDVLENKLLSKDHDLRKYKIPAFEENRGLFVTLMKNENLRGCIGRIEPVNTIYNHFSRDEKLISADGIGQYKVVCGTNT